MDKQNPIVLNLNIQNVQVNINTQSPIQDNSVNKPIVKKKKKSPCLQKLAGMFRALVKFLGSIDPNIIIMLITMMFGIRL